MGRHSYNEHSGAQFEDSHPGCMSVIHHILDNHHWHQVRKMLPQRRHRRGRHTRCNGSPTTISYDRATGEEQEWMESETNCLMVKQHAKEMFKEENQKCWIGCFPTSTWSHFEQQHYCDISPDWTSQDPSLPKTSEELVVCSRKCNLCSNTNAADYLGHSHLVEKHEHLPEKCDGVMEASVNEEVLHHQLKEYADVLEIVKVNKGLFLEILQDADVGVAKQFNGLQTANPNKRFSKSRSFPAFDSSRIRNVTSSTLEHKQNEIWFFPKGKKYLFAGTKPPKLAAAMCPKNYDLQQMTLMVDNNVGSATEQEISFSSLGLAHSLNNRGRSRFLVNLFKYIKQKIKHALKGSKKESATGQDGMDVPRYSIETEASDYDSCSNGRLHNIRKSSSLNKSLDKYTRLFEYSFGKETKGHRLSFKLTNEERISLNRRDPRSCRRNLSMPDLESFCSLLINELSSDVLCSGMEVRTFVDHSTNTECDNHNDQNSGNIPVNTEKIQPPQALVKIEFQENKVERSNSSASIEYPAGLVDINGKGISKPCDINEDIAVLIATESSPHQEREIDLMMNSSSEFEQQDLVPVPETCRPDSETSPAMFPIAEGSEFNPRSKHLNFENIESTSKSVGSRFLHFELNEKDDADFNYVKNVLELSGFIGNDQHLGTWHSKDQPLNPSFFEKLEACYPHELECSEEEVVGNWDHQFLFNLVNEAILDMQERSVSYFPKAMPFNCCIHPTPIGRHFLHHVWARINRFLSSRPEVEQPLDDAVARDLAKDDGWMNLLFETEFVALELEKLIFEELMDEVICS